MLVKLQLNKSSTANWLFAAFFLILLLGAGISEFFQAPNSPDHQLNRYRSLLQGQELQGITELHLENRLGEFHLKTNDDGRWQLSSPRKLPADKKNLQNIFQSLESIRIRRVYPKDQINIANFSLDAPLLTLTYKKSGNEKPVTLKLGLVNPIDNSTYIMLSNRDAIYHIDALNSSLEILGLSDFVDSKVFSLPDQKITGVKIYRRSPEKENLRLEFYKKNGTWQNDEGEELQETKVSGFIKRLTNIKSQFILDKMSGELQDTLAYPMKHPAYTVILDREKKKAVKYHISGLISKSLPDLNVEKGNIFLVKSSTFDHPYIVPKEHYKIFGTRQKEFERLPFKKLFY